MASTSKLQIAKLARIERALPQSPESSEDEEARIASVVARFGNLQEYERNREAGKAESAALAAKFASPIEPPQVQPPINVLPEPSPFEAIKQAERSGHLQTIEVN